MLPHIKDREQQASVTLLPLTISSHVEIIMGKCYLSLSLAFCLMPHNLETMSGREDMLRFSLMMPFNAHYSYIIGNLLL